MCKQKPVANILKVAIIRLKILNDSIIILAQYILAQLNLLRRVLFWSPHWHRPHTPLSN